MTLTVCPECNGTVSDRATVCPHCGFPIATESTEQKFQESMTDFKEIQ